MTGRSMPNHEPIPMPIRPAQPRPDEHFISKAEVAVRLGMTARTVEHWMQRGIIPYLKIGRGRRATVLFKWPDIEAHLKSNYGRG